MELPAQLKLIQQKKGNHHQQEKHEDQPTLPFTTSLSNYLLPLTQPNHHPSNLTKLPFRYLSLILIRELAILEDLFIQSPLYRLIRYLTPSFLLSQSSSYPFLLTITIALVQLRRTWNRQPKLLVNLFISLGPIVHTLRALHALDPQHSPHYSLPSSSSEFISQSTHHLHHLKRWSIYWILYCSLIILESSNVRVEDYSRHTLLPSRPAIYPSIPQPRKNSDRLSAFSLLTYTKISKFFELFSSRYPSNSLLDFIIPKSIVKASSKLFLSQGPKPLKVSMQPLDIYPLSPNLTRRIKRLPLPQYLFGKNDKVYMLLKVVLLRWCSSEESRVLEIIWSGLFSPIASLMGRVGPDPTGKKTRANKAKVVKVTVSSNEEEEDADDGGDEESHPEPKGSNLSESHDHLWRTVPGGLYYQSTDQNQAETQKIVGGYSGSSPMRRRRSDPGRGSVSSVPTIHRLPDAHDHSRSSRQNLHLIRSSCSHTSIRSTNPSTALELVDEKSSHPSIPILKHNSPHAQHPLLEFKTPENAWDSLSYIG